MTNVFLTTTGADAAVTVGSGTKKLADFTAGAASQLYNQNTVVGPTSGLQLTDGTSAFTVGTLISWYTKPLQAVTIAGQIVAQCWGHEQSSTDNIAPCMRVERCSGSGTILATIVDQSSTNHGAGELANAAGGDAHTMTAAAVDVVDTALVDGDRLRISLWFRDASSQGGVGTMDADAGQMYVNGPTGSAGQSQFAFTETLVEFAAGAAGPVAAPQSFPPFGPPFADPFATPFQLLGDSGPPSAAAVTLTDTGSGSDALTSTAAAVLVDTGTGADALAVAATVALSETGSAADALSVSAAVALPDTAAGADTLAAAGSTDPYQAGPQFAAMFLQPSAASFQLAGDTSTTSASINLADIGTGSDALAAAAAVPLADTAVGTEGFTVTVTAAITDVGTGSDVLTGTAAIPLTDAGAGGDVLTATAAVPLTDVGTGVDALTVSGSNNPNLPDTATGTDALTVSAAAALSDTAAGTDQATATAAVPLADVGTAADSLTISVTNSGPVAGPILVPPFGPPFAIWVVPFQLQGGGGPLAPVPVTVTGSDRPTTTVTGSDRPTVTIASN